MQLGALPFLRLLLMGLQYRVQYMSMQGKNAEHLCTKIGSQRTKKRDTKKIGLQPSEKAFRSGRMYAQ